MDISLFQQLLLRCGAIRRTPLIIGKHGVGKSAIIRATFEAKGYEVVDLRLGQMESGDLIGSPDREYYCPRCGTTYGQGGTQFCQMDTCVSKKIKLVGHTVWLAPSWFPTPDKPKVVLFFDELNRGRQDVLQSVFQVVLDRKLHTHQLPPETVVIAAGNPSGGDYNVEELDPALLDRFVVIKWNLKDKEWLTWARHEEHIIPEIIDFIGTDSKYLGNDPIDMKMDVTPSPRAYEMLSDLLRQTGEFKIERPYWGEVAGMLIGEAPAMAFVASLKTDIEKPVKAKEILEKFTDATKKKVTAQAEKSRIDLLKVTLDELTQVLAESSSKYTPEQLGNVGDFLKMIQEDLAFVALKDFARNADVNERLLLKRPDLFAMLMKSRQSTGKK